MRENWNYYKKRLTYIMLLIALVLGVHGLYAYYSPIITQPWRLVSAMLYGTMKLFLFAPPIPAQAESTISYQIAMWLAPILTSALVLTKITNLLLHFRNRMRNRFSKKYLVIFEKSDKIDSLINNLIDDGNQYDVSLILKDPISQEWRKQYEKKKVAVYEFDIENANQKDISSLFKNLNLNRARHIIFGTESDLENYSRFQNTIRYLKPEVEMNVYINCLSGSIPEYIEKYLGSAKIQEPKLAKLDIISYNFRELTTRKLLSDLRSEEGLLKLNLKGLRELSKTDSEYTVEKIDEAVGNVHFLVLGANELTAPLFKMAANNATISLSNKVKFTLMDDDAEQVIEKYIFDNEEILGALDIDAISVNLKSKMLSKRLSEMRGGNEPTAIFFMKEDTILNLETLAVVDKYFYNEPKALRNTSAIDLESLLPSGHEELRVFGSIEEIMNESVMLRSKLDSKAKGFNSSYNEISDSLGMGRGSVWYELSQTKKNSSRASADHAAIKEAIIRNLYPGKTDIELRGMITEKLEEFKIIEQKYRDDKEGFKWAFSEFLRENPILDYMSRLEHKRWNNSYYAMNFRYGTERDEAEKTHPCLIDEWEVIMNDSFENCQPVYDLMATFALFK